MDIYLISDLTVGNAEDLDTVLYNTVSLLINYLVHGIGNIGLIIFNSKDVLLSFPPTNPIYLLKKILEYSDKFMVYGRNYNFILDEPDINLIIGKGELAEIEYLLLYESYRNSILSHVNNILLKLAINPSSMILIKSNSGNRNLYPIFKYSLRKLGHDIKEYKSEIEVEELARYML